MPSGRNDLGVKKRSKSFSKQILHADTEFNRAISRLTRQASERIDFADARTRSPVRTQTRWVDLLQTQIQTWLQFCTHIRDYALGETVEKFDTDLRPLYALLSA